MDRVQDKYYDDITRPLTSPTVPLTFQHLHPTRSCVAHAIAPETRRHHVAAYVPPLLLVPLEAEDTCPRRERMRMDGRGDARWRRMGARRTGGWARQAMEAMERGD